MPPDGHLVLAAYRNEYTKWRRIRAMYVPRYTVPDDGEYNADEYCEEKDQFFLREGWYEVNEWEDVHWAVGHPVTHWMPLADPPADF